LKHTGAEADHIRLSGPLTIRYISELKEILASSLASHQSIDIEIPSEAEADISFVQLLISVQVSARASGKAVKLSHDPQGPLLDVLTRGGFLESDIAGLWTTEGVLQ
jgi:ABC-type transporter Mla MlaB component